MAQFDNHASERSHVAFATGDARGNLRFSSARRPRALGALRRVLGRISNPYRNWHNRLHLEPSRAYSGSRALSGHLISYDLARGLHIIAVIAWIAGMLMLPRFYAAITAAPHGEAGEEEMLRHARHIRTLIVTPSMIMAWAFGIFLFFTYFASDWDDPVPRLVAVPHWFWAKLGLVLSLTAYHGMLIVEGRRLAAGERRRSVRFWQGLSVVPFLIAIAIVLLATLEP